MPQGLLRLRNHTAEGSVRGARGNRLARIDLPGAFYHRSVNIRGDCIAALQHLYRPGQIQLLFQFGHAAKSQSAAVAHGGHQLGLQAVEPGGQFRAAQMGLTPLQFLGIVRQLIPGHPNACATVLAQPIVAIIQPSPALRHLVARLDIGDLPRGGFRFSHRHP